MEDKINTMEEDSNRKESSQAENNVKSTAKEEKGQGSRNMKFFSEIIRTLNLNQKQLSKRTGYSEQVISHWIIADDCRLSTVLKVFDKLNLDISCSFTPASGNNYEISEDNYRIKMEGVQIFANEDDKAERENVLADSIKKQGRLAFLAKFIMNAGYKLKPFCKYVDFDYNVVYLWFSKDDIRISRIYAIAKACNQKVNWEVKPKKKDNAEETKA